MRANEIHRGLALRFDNELYAVVDTSTMKPGKGGAFVRAKLKSLKTGAVSERRLRSDETVEDVFLDRRKVQYLYKEGSGFVFMDLETYEQYTIDGQLLGESSLYLVSELEAKVCFCEGKTISVELPASVDMKITETDAAIKGQTAAKSSKPATTETGLKIQVPPFVNNGEVIKVDTREGKYLGRA